MAMSQNMGSLLEMVKYLSEADQAALADQIMSMLSAPHTGKPAVIRELAFEVSPAKPDCPHCAAKAALGYVVKHGKSKGLQRYLCKSCGKHFVPTTNTAFAWSRKSAETWRKFICLTISGKSLHVCCRECGIAYQTAFTWRHKILNAFVENQKATKMSGRIEVDEMLIPLSYKGNHVKGGFYGRKLLPGMDNGLPRKSYKRGSDNKSKSSKDKACVFCMVEDGNKRFYAAVPGIGFMNKEMLDATVGRHVNKQTAMMLADNYKVTRNYLKENGYNYYTLYSNTSDNPNAHKPEIDGSLHLQHVNSMHSHIRTFLKPYYGVSSKYLENYMALYVWLKTVRLAKSRNSTERMSVARAATPDCYVSRKIIECRPAVPMCA